VVPRLESSSGVRALWRLGGGIWQTYRDGGGTARAAKSVHPLDRHTPPRPRPGMWILLRDGNNRKVLGTSFNPSPANALAKNMISKLNDAITLHEINDEVAAKTAKLKQARGGRGRVNGRLC
jgi:hypothetical protein